MSYPTFKIKPPLSQPHFMPLFLHPSYYCVPATVNFLPSPPTCFALQHLHASHLYSLCLGSSAPFFFQPLNFLLILQNPANKSLLPDVLSKSPDTVTSLLVLSWVIVGLRCTAVSNFVCPSVPLYRELLQERDRISYIISSKLS